MSKKRVFRAFSGDKLMVYVFLAFVALALFSYIYVAASGSVCAFAEKQKELI